MEMIIDGIGEVLGTLEQRTFKLLLLKNQNNNNIFPPNNFFSFNFFFLYISTQNQ